MLAGWLRAKTNSSAWRGGMAGFRLGAACSWVGS
jgi:hypothetical protein